METVCDAPHHRVNTKKRRTYAAALAATLCVLVVGSVWAGSVSGLFVSGPKLVALDEHAEYKVTRVIDGDTFKAMIGAQEITVRVLGVNTPETVDPRKPPECYGKEASDEVKSLLEGRTVRLVQNPHREATDKYGRYLLYVYRDDGLFLNEYLLQKGYAREYTVGRPYDMQVEFRQIEATAKAAGRGLWRACEAAAA